MPLTYPPEWKFDSDGVTAPRGLIGDLFDLIKRIATGSTDPKGVVETFKERFGAESSSSSLDWAYSDLSSAMDASAAHGAVFAESLWLAVEDVRADGVAAPTAPQLNKLFQKHGFPYEIAPPRLSRRGVDAVLADRAPEQGETTQALMPYTLDEEIGRGGFGRVFRTSRATSVATFSFALKLLDPSPFNTDPVRAKARFTREVQAVQRLQHRGIVPYVDAGLDQQGRPYLVMPLIEGADIRTAAGARPFLDRVGLMVEVLDAVAHAHALDVLHRDLKPSNILVRVSDGQPIVVDFGQSYLFDDMDGASLTTTAVGSIGYIPSEVLADPKFRTPLQDIFACGVITYEIIAGRRPDPGVYRPLAAIDATLAPLDGVLRKALAPASTRFTTAASLRDALRAGLTGTR